MWAKHPFLNELYEETINGHVEVNDAESRQLLLTKFQGALGQFSRGNLAPLDPVILAETQKVGYKRYSIEITTLPALRMQFYLLVPDQLSLERAPAILALHGHGYGNKDIVGIENNGAERTCEPGYHRDFAIELVKKGMIVVAPELIGFGDRRYAPGYTPESDVDNSCYSLASQLLLMGKTLAGLRIFECQRVLDYLQTRKEVNPDQIGCMGISGGGLVAGFTTVLDERIKAVVVSGYTNTFLGSILDRRHCLDNYIPGMLTIAEMPALIGLIAPRRLLIEAGRQDHLFPERHVKIAVNQLTKIYQSFDFEQGLHVHFFDGGHEISGEVSYDWLKEQLS